MNNDFSDIVNDLVLEMTEGPNPPLEVRRIEKRDENVLSDKEMSAVKKTARDAVTRIRSGDLFD